MKKKILIIEDFETTRFVLKTALRSNYDVLEAENGKEALKILFETDEVSLIVTDLNMPEMDGIEFTKKVRGDENYKHIPIIMVTTEISPEKKTEAKAAGVTWWAKKPYKIGSFLSIIERAVL